jgi:lysozyme
VNRDALVDRLKVHEGLELKPYRDTVGKLTIGIGRNLDDVGISADEARQLCLNDVIKVEQQLDASLPWWRNMDEVRQQVLAEMCFNLGITRLLGFSHMLAYLEVGNTSGAAEEMLNSAWAHQVGKRAQVLSRAMKMGAF